MRLGTNRGNPRLWLEGAILTEAGFDRGTRYAVTIGSAAIVLDVAPDGKRSVAGKTKAGGANHPIIDMNGAYLAPFANRDLTLTSHNGRIIIIREA